MSIGIPAIAGSKRYIIYAHKTSNNIEISCSTEMRMQNLVGLTLPITLRLSAELFKKNPSYFKQKKLPVKINIPKMGQYSHAPFVSSFNRT